ncbi:hypothetical protein HK104_002220 [Borealophlyctis nickersoniae]|nr:hypothetical protein HK104_002220 [Borealophlyctis nickersoniae]
MLDPTLDLPTEVTLEEFRRQWKAEVSTKKAASASGSEHIDAGKSSLPAAASSSSSSSAAQSQPPQHPTKPGRKAGQRGGVAAAGSSSASSSVPVAAGSDAGASGSMGMGKGRADTRSSTASIVDPPGSLDVGAGAAKKETMSQSLRIYINATNQERMGNLSAAIRGYREAIRLDPTVEQAFRAHSIRSAAAATSSADHAEEDPNAAFYTYYNIGHDDPTAGNDSHEMNSLIDALRCMDVSFTPKRKGAKVLLSKLPNEILAHVVEPEPDYDSLLEEARLAYVDNWMTMFIEKPRIRRDGLYISRVNYIRMGQGESFYAPVHLVTYFRFLRFLPDNRVLCWTTTIEPAVAVKLMLSETRQKGWMTGSYEMVMNTVGLVMRDADRRGQVFKCTLTLSSTRRGRQNKLSWVEYWQEQDNDPDYRSDVPIRTLKPFMFSKVKSYRGI